ncbi:DUF6397 family protein [Streptomyces sp. NPDC088387]|uniref:DUF6397 family protein n=1 Tax=Streptomyces sp. NPDC088387 TaxID=3365859 RepID=UPI00380BDBD2
MSGNTIAYPESAFWAPGRAARELGLKRSELDLAVRLGRIRSVPDPSGAGRRITRAEIDRLRSEDGFPDALRESIRAVAAPEGATVMDVPQSRLTRLARLGLVVPVSFYINRYRTLVWLYLADELREFAADERNAVHLKGRAPEGVRELLNEGLDLRPRNWRGRHLGFLLREAHDPWAQAAAVASLLDRALVSDIVRDPYERAHLNRFRPMSPAHGSPGSPTADLAEQIMTASDPDEIDWLRTDLTQALAEARAVRPAPRPSPRPTTQPAASAAQPPAARPAQPPAARAAHRPDADQRPDHGCTAHRRTTDEHNGRRTAAHPPGEESKEPRRLMGWLRRRSS